jgi:hypothetical protein
MLDDLTSEVKGTLLDAALAYAAQGWHIFPLKPGEKRPIYDGGFKLATTDPDQIRAWWAANPQANIGYLPGKSGVVVADVDPKNGPDPQTVAALPDTLMVKSPRGVHHHYASLGMLYGNGQLAQGIDIRCAAGYVLLPPSVIDERQGDGPEACGAYEWLNEAWPTPFPEWAATKLAKPKQEPRATPPDRELDTPERIAKVRELATLWSPSTMGMGSNAATIEMVNRLLDLCSHDVVFDAMRELWIPKCGGGEWTEEWLREKVYSVKPGSGRDSEIGCEVYPIEYGYKPDVIQGSPPEAEAEDDGGPRVINTAATYDNHRVTAKWVTYADDDGDDDGEPLPELAPGWVEKHVVTYLEGPGGLGKSMIALQDAICLAAGHEILGETVEQTSVLYLNYEEKADEFKRRRNRIKRHFGIAKGGDFQALHLKNEPAAHLLRVTKDGALILTRFGREFHAKLAERRDRGLHTFVVLDGIIDAVLFEGSTRVDDTIARQVIALLDRWCEEYDFTAYAILHPSRAAERQGGGSYAPAWSTKPRVIHTFDRVTFDNKKTTKDTPSSQCFTRERSRSAATGRLVTSSSCGSAMTASNRCLCMPMAAARTRLTWRLT